MTKSVTQPRFHGNRSAAVARVAARGILSGVFERFTERARQVVVLAQEEARRLRHGYIGTEHILLGLLRVEDGEEDGPAARVLGSLNITVERVRDQLAQILVPVEVVPSSDEMLPFTPRAKRVLELARRESMDLGHHYIGTEHILLGLVRVNEGVASRILRESGADADKIHNRVIRSLEIGSQSAGRASSRPIDPSWFDGLGRVLNQLADEIRDQLRREPDAGDVLLVLTTATGSLAAQALEQLNVDSDQLWSQIEHLRLQAQQARQQLTEQLEQARIDKERAIGAQEMQTAANHRDQERTLERKLTAQQRTQTLVSAEALETIRHRLGLTKPN